ncbi:MAG: metallophosphoesterase [Clostridia bacterium]|nr:metallophosphoesterase [Clostridia bacterium]
MKICRDPFYTVLDTELVIPGLRRQYKIIHITDLHLSVFDELSTEEEKQKAIAQEAFWQEGRERVALIFNEPFDDSKRISSREILDKMISFAKEETPDLLVMTGDMLDYISPAGIKALKGALEGYKGRVMFVEGNHDENCGFAKEDVDTVEFEDLILAGVNNGSFTVSSNQISQLKTLCEGTKPLIIVQHVPVMTEKNKSVLSRLDKYYYIDKNAPKDGNAREFAELEESCDDIRAVLCGHTHGFLPMELAEGRPEYCGSSALCGFVHRITVK